MHRVALLEETPFSHNGMAVVAKLPKMSKVVEATVEKVCEVVEVVVPIHSGESRPNAVLHNLSRLLSNFLKFEKNLVNRSQFTGFELKATCAHVEFHGLARPRRWEKPHPKQN